MVAALISMPVTGTSNLSAVSVEPPPPITATAGFERVASRRGVDRFLDPSDSGRPSTQPRGERELFWVMSLRYREERPVLPQGGVGR
jgi:hypothetical protein